MTRPYSWYPLATSDPVPGEPVVVRSGGAHYQRVATAIGDAERVLRTIVDAQDAVSDAVDAIRDRTHAVADRIRTAHARYTAAGDALVAYAARLDTAQTSSLDALHIAQAAQRTLDVSQDAVRRWTHLLDEATDAGEDATTQQRALTAARADRAEADAALERARSMLAEAVADRDAAARTALALIDAGTSDGPHDGWWEDWGADVAQVVSTWAGNIATTAGLLSLVLGWVPFLGQVLMVVALVAGAAALAADLTLAVKRGDGQDWFNVAMGLVGIATFGVGRVLAGAADAFGASARAATTQASHQTVRSLVSRLLRPTSPRPASTPAKSTIESLATGANPSVGRLAEAWAHVRSTRGLDRVLALAGHGDLVTQNNALRAQLWDAFPFQPAAFLTLIGPAARGTVLEAGAVVLYVGDTAMAMTSTSKAVVDHARGPQPDAARRLEL